MRNARQLIVPILTLVLASGMPVPAAAADGTHPMLAMLLWLGAPLFMICAGLGVAVAAQAFARFRSSRERKKHARARSARTGSANQKRATLRIVHSKGAS